MVGLLAGDPSIVLISETNSFVVDTLRLEGSGVWNPDRTAWRTCCRSLALFVCFFGHCWFSLCCQPLWGVDRVPGPVPEEGKQDIKKDSNLNVGSS